MTRRAWIPYFVLADDVSKVTGLWTEPEPRYAAAYVEVLICPVSEAQPFGERCSCFAHLTEVVVVPAPGAGRTRDVEAAAELGVGVPEYQRPREQP